MVASRFDTLARLLTDPSSRRGLLRSLAAGLGLKVAYVPTGGDAKKRNKPRPNEFGCLNVGQACGGKDAKCCSGICQGKKPKKGEKDRSRCVAHHTGGCQAGQQEVFCGGTNVDCTTSTGHAGVCNTTTGIAGYCNVFGDGQCVACSNDADCQALCGLETAACIKCPNCGGDEIQTACVGPSPGDCAV